MYMLKTALRHRLAAYRNPIYIVYVVAGLLVFLFGWLVVRGGVGSLETYVFRFFNELPAFLAPIMVAISLFGTIGFVFVAALLSLFRRHYAHATKFLLAGVFAWLVVKWLKTYAIRARPSEILPNVQLREKLDSVIGYPSGHAAVVTALGVVAYMYVPKRYHRFITLIIIAVCISRLYLGMHLPMDVIGGFGVGLAIGSSLNFLFGDTRGKFVSTKLLKRKLNSLHLNVKSVVRASVDARGSTPFFATLDDGSKLFIKVVDTSNNVADWLFKLTRKVRYRRLEDEAPFFTPKRQLEHEAYIAGLARNHEIRTPMILGIFHVKEDMWAMAQTMIEGTGLDDLNPSKLTPELLAKIWQQVGRLHHANIIHRDLRAANIFVDTQDNPWLIDFGFAEASVSSRSFHRDTVELIASLSCIVNPKDVITAAKKTIGTEELAAALPYLDYASLSGATTKLLKSQKGKLASIRNLLMEASSTKQVSRVAIKRFSIKTFIYIAAIGIALFVLIPQLPEFGASLDSLKQSNPNFIVWAIICSLLTYPAAAGVYTIISIYPIRYFRTLLISIATSFTSRLLPASSGAMATEARYLNKSGYSAVEAGSLVALNNLIGFMGHMLILFVVAGLTRTSLSSIIKVPVSRKVIIIAAIIVSIVFITVVAISKLRRKAKKTINDLGRDITKLLQEPGRFAFALLSAMLITSLYAGALYFCAQATGLTITILQAFFVLTIGVTAASVTPTPGGIGGAEAGLVAGFVSIGIDSSTALSISLIYRLITFWLPILPGFVAFHHASEKGYI